MIFKLAVSAIAALLATLAGAARAEDAGWPDLSHPPTAAEGGGGKDAALIVSIERYAELPGIAGASANGNDWHTYLTNGRRIPPEHITYLRDNEATLEKMRKFAAQAAHQVQPGGTLWFVFIGHGAPARDGSDGILVGYDAQQDADSLYARSLGQKELLKIVGGGAQSRSVVVLDACFSGRNGDGKALVGGLQPLILVKHAATQQAIKNALLLTAAKGDQFAGPLPGASRPAFSYLVLGGLRGWADENGDHKVTAREVRDYTRKALLTLVKDRNQEPQLAGDRPEDVLAVGGEAGPDLARFQRGALAASASVTAPTAPPSQPAPTGPLTVAIAEFKAQGVPPSSEWLGRSFADGVISKLARAGQVRIVEREYLDQILGELKLSKSGAVDERSAARVGRLLGARVFVFGTVSQLNDQVLVRARTVSVERGEVLDTAEAQGNPNGILALQHEIARQIATALAVDAALGEDGGTAERDAPTLASLGDLERLRKLARGIPSFGLDPARRRRNGEYQQGLAICERLLTAHPGLAPAHFYRALFSLHAEDLETADVESQVALKAAPDEVTTHLLRANVLMTRRNEDAAIDVLNAAARRFPDDARPWNALGRLNAKRAQPVDAAVDYLAALQRTPTILDAETNLQTLLAGDSGRAVLAGLQAQHPRSYPAALAFRVYFNNDAGDVGAVAAQAEAQSPKLYIAHYLAGVADMRAGRDTDAYREWQTALSLRPDFPEVHRELGTLLLRQRNCEDGSAHVTIYLRTARVVDDYAGLEQKLQQCAQ